MIRGRPTASWPLPPEVPPNRPSRPDQPGAPQPARQDPRVPSWEEPYTTERDLSDRLLDMRIVHLGGALDEDLANRGIAQLLLLDRRGRNSIELHLNCPESELDASLALAGTVETVSAPVHVIVHGTLVGPVIAALCAGEERGAHRGASLVLSVPDASAQGTAHQMTVHAEQHERQLARLRDHIVRATGQSADDVEHDLRTGRVLSADDALTYGLLTRLL
ncbi:ATP-dependent Clp protease proteolytic subunit [Phytoactinopolyspora halotolerans]|uniref:ATP-dependent Clp protease proteolytic subunit n=1 Tax=Phytoactinopolyspora halotolerans TaxID=1981512 RepID=A0A6L9SBY2_9ACTN|nr:ATP-dependent Clp protease proteolytic subunit [Phytoactinopolyspora halotolerans]NEE01520.1 ATP-dependent Clp protease proteolytic subunit [Phytoactinopolyspora halotolerans]